MGIQFQNLRAKGRDTNYLDNFSSSLLSIAVTQHAFSHYAELILLHFPLRSNVLPVFCTIFLYRKQNAMDVSSLICNQASVKTY